jgi:hypothetical protein
LGAIGELGVDVSYEEDPVALPLMHWQLNLPKKKGERTNKRQCNLTASQKGWNFGVSPTNQAAIYCFKICSDGMTSIDQTTT